MFKTLILLSQLGHVKQLQHKNVFPREFFPHQYSHVVVRYHGKYRWSMVARLQAIMYKHIHMPLIHRSSTSCSPIPSSITSSSSDSPLCTSTTPSLFHSRLKTYLFHKSYPRSFISSSRTASTDFWVHRFFWAIRFLIVFFIIFFVSGPCARLSWPSRQLLSTRNLPYRIV